MSPEPAAVLALLAARRRAIEARYGLRLAALAGSTARATAGPKSDIDVLVDVVGDPSYLDVARAEVELSDALGRPVDLIVRRSLRPARRAAAEAGMIPIP